MINITFLIAFYKGKDGLLKNVKSGLYHMPREFFIKI